MAVGEQDVIEGPAEIEHAATGLPQLNFETWPSQVFWLIVALVFVSVMVFCLFTTSVIIRAHRAG